MNMPDTVINQHVIDPELCIRCGSCEAACPSQAISHGQEGNCNVVVDASICNSCMECVPECPTGAIDNWRPTLKGAVFTLAQQLQWEKLPQPVSLPPEAAAGFEPMVSVGRGAPSSAGTPVENRFTRDHPALAEVTESTRVTTEDCASEIRHIVLDVGPDFPFLEGQSIGVIPPGVDANGRPHQMRLYSIASARTGENGMAGTFALTIKRTVEDNEGQPYRGICSNHMCDLQVGDRVEVVGPYGASFLMPNDPASSLLMISTGTGIAPMRGMIEQRLHQRDALSGGQALFYGGRTPQELPYYDELQKLPEGFLDLHVAFSRVAGQPKQYVQDQLRARHEDVAKMLADDNCYIYLCGLKGMESGVLEAFHAICVDHGLDWQVLETKLHKKTRLHIETY